MQAGSAPPALTSRYVQKTENNNDEKSTHSALPRIHNCSTYHPSLVYRRGVPKNPSLIAGRVLKTRYQMNPGENSPVVGDFMLPLGVPP